MHTLSLSFRLLNTVEELAKRRVSLLFFTWLEG